MSNVWRGSPGANGRSAEISQKEEGRMRVLLLALGVAIIALPAGTAESPALSLGCDKSNADPQYCRDHQRRPVCMANGHVVWKDTQTPISQGESIFLAEDGPLPTPKCQ
jgi:hypothetical protein